MSSLKLFRSTGYSSMFAAGESRVAVHPAWAIAAVSAWIGFGCNVQLWRVASGGSPSPQDWVHALAIGLLVAAASAGVLSILGWHKTFKPAATFLMGTAALFAASAWVQSLPLDATLSAYSMTALLVPPWARLLQWQFCALVAVLALVPMAWMWQTRLRRLSGPRQLRINLIGTGVSGAVVALSLFVLSRGFH